MEKQSLKRSYRRWIAAHILFWTIYSVLVARVLPGVTDLKGFADWNEQQKFLLALVPVIPVALWAYVTGRFWARSPDELGVSVSYKAAATAGAILALIVFAAGWINVIGGAGALPVLRFGGVDWSPFFGVGLFLLVYSVQMFRLQQKAVL